jgi:hypothetical protein
MRSIVLALTELLGVLVAGFLGFFVMLAYVAGFLLLLACGFACAGFLLVALFSMVMWLFNHDAHAFRMMLGYFAYAGRSLRRDCCTRLLPRQVRRWCKGQARTTSCAAPDRPAPFDEGRDLRASGAFRPMTALDPLAT